MIDIPLWSSNLYLSPFVNTFTYLISGVREFSTDGVSSTVPPVPLHEGSVNFSLRTRRLNGNLMIYLLTQRNVESLHMYVIRFKNDLFGDAEILRCSILAGTRTAVLPGSVARSCRLVMKQAVVSGLFCYNLYVSVVRRVQEPFLLFWQYGLTTKVRYMKRKMFHV